jgi:hypothetical protein
MMSQPNRIGIVIAFASTACVAQQDAQVVRGDYQVQVGSHALTYVGKHSNITDFRGYGQHLVYFPLFGLTSPATAERTDDRDVYHQGIFKQFEHHKLLSLDSRTFSPDAGGDPLGVKTKGGFAAWPMFTLPNGVTGRSGTVYDDATLDGNSNNVINQVITKHDEPRDWCLNVIVDNTAGANNPDKRLEARLDSGGTEIDINLAGHPDFTFDGRPDMYTFLYEGMNDDERFKLRLATFATENHHGAGFGGIMVSDVSTCTDVPDPCEAGECEPPSPGVTMGAWAGFSTTPHSHPAMPGTQRLLVFTAHGRDKDNRYVQGVTYGGQAMTKLVSKTHCDSRCLHSSIWYLKEAGIAAAAGAGFAVNWNNNPSDRGYDSVFFAGVRQAAPFDASHAAASSGSTVACAANVVEAGHIQIYSASHKNQGDYVALGGFTEAADYKLGSEGKGAVGHLAGTGASVTAGVAMHANPQTIVCAELQN